MSTRRTARKRVVLGLSARCSSLARSASLAGNRYSPLSRCPKPPLAWTDLHCHISALPQPITVSASCFVSVLARPQDRFTRSVWPTRLSATIRPNSTTAHRPALPHLCTASTNNSLCCVFRFVLTRPQNRLTTLCLAFTAHCNDPAKFNHRPSTCTRHRSAPPRNPSRSTSRKPPSLVSSP